MLQFPPSPQRQRRNRRQYTEANQQGGARRGRCGWPPRRCTCRHYRPDCRAGPVHCSRCRSTRRRRRRSTDTRYRPNSSTRCVRGNSNVHQARTASSSRHYALRKAGLHHVTLHGLRHTFASTAILDGCPVTQVAHLLGHKSAIVPLAVYSHWFSQLESDDAVERVAQRLSGGTAGKKTVETDRHR